LLVRSESAPSEVTQELLRWATEQLRKNSREDQAVGLSCLRVLLRADEFRVQFAEEDGINKLGTIVRENSGNAQLLYEALYCMWLITYNEKLSQSFEQTNVIPKIVETVRTVSKEKCIRMGLAILKNLLNLGRNNEQMIEAGFFKVLENLQQRKWADNEMIEDMEVLRVEMEKKLEEFSSWDIYKAEVLSGNLDWSPVHKSERFWRANVINFEEQNFRILGVLCDILRTQQNTLTLAVACHDIGQFITHHPRGRTIINTLGAKSVIMTHMTHKDPEVQKQALLCVQKLMVANWEYLAR